jgi:O-methyltransferase domain/Dimerisation domain
MSAGSPDRIVALGYAYRGAKALLSAVELGVFRTLAKQSLDAEALAFEIGIAKRGARDFFDALVALDLLRRDETGCYSNTPETELYLDPGKPTYSGGELEFINATLYERWNALTTALRIGGSPNKASSAGHYSDRYAKPAAVEAFARAMTAATLPVASAIAAKFAWSRYQTFLDIGSAEGCLPVAVARVHSNVAGGGFDLPPVKPVFDRYVAAHNLSDRLVFHSGDFFQDAMPKADVLVIGRVLHNWDLEAKKILLRKAYEALPVGGALIVYERLIDDERRSNARALLSSLNMLLMTAGGFEFSGAECGSWMQDVGFRDVYVEPLVSEHSMIVGRK